ncbi:MAG: hypothetical protein M5U01_42510 [Ardenticatenaceae bacterium]|nr:hypothetical protein [Ardenticatenaceae bacterium]
MSQSKQLRRAAGVRLGDTLTQSVRAVVGLLLIQLALPKVLPLPGISARWALIVIGGGVPGIIASLVGGTVILAYGVSLLPRAGWPAWRWGAMATAVAAITRLGAVLLIAAVGNQPPTHYPWDGPLPPWASLLVALALVALVYGSLTVAVVRLVRRATHLPH